MASVIVQLIEVLKTLTSLKVAHPAPFLSPRIPTLLDTFVPLLIGPCFSFLPDALVWLTPLVSAYELSHTAAMVEFLFPLVPFYKVLLSSNIQERHRITSIQHLLTAICHNPEDLSSFDSVLLESLRCLEKHSKDNTHLSWLSESFSRLSLGIIFPHLHASCLNKKKNTKKKLV